MHAGTADSDGAEGVACPNRHGAGDASATAEGTTAVAVTESRDGTRASCGMEVLRGCGVAEGTFTTSKAASEQDRCVGGCW
mmetsp:Transcript_109763/g.276083  ORF Transcript_109763/g.276083 Transcript_109763/m.276083 type:complete len:81 (-) Transcript_109763:76-318(-)